MNYQAIAIKQYRDYIVTPVLKEFNMHSEAAVRLVLGTAAQESKFEFVKQIGKGPALGWYQMEPATHNDIWDNYITFKPNLRDKILFGVGAIFHHDIEMHNLLIGNAFYATLMCRLHYRRRKEPLPHEDDIEGMAAYWKQFYNTYKGKGTVEEFIDSYYTIIGENHAQ